MDGRELELVTGKWNRREQKQNSLETAALTSVVVRALVEAYDWYLSTSRTPGARW